MHKMNLWNDSFKAIKDGWKTIEMRLNDEKRSKIKIGDEIEFTNVKTNELLICKVTNLFKYKNFEELYNDHNKISIGYTENEIANPDDMLMYYSKEDIEMDKHTVKEVQEQLNEAVEFSFKYYGNFLMTFEDISD